MREPQCKEFSNLELYLLWHQDQYQNNNSLKETNLKVVDNGEVKCEYINVRE
jgi:hypothetical protein